MSDEAARGRGAAGLSSDLLRFGLREAGVAVALVLIVIFFSLTAPYFATPENFLKIFVQIGINTVLASGMTFVILTGGIDLSVGSVLALCTVVGALIMTNPSLPFVVSIPLALLGCMGVGSLCGFVNGFVVEQWKVPSFIVTLGMLNVASGAARVVSDNATITGLPQPFIDFGNMIVFGVFPSIFLIAVGVILIGWFVLRFTVFGRFIYAIGTNEEAVRLSGHNPRTYKVAAFVISGLTAGVAAMVYLLRLNVGSPIAGVGYELNAIAAVIIGGTSLSGGKGSIIGTLVGACIIQVLSTGLQLFGVGDNVKPIVIGTVIVLAVVLDAYRDRYLRVIEFALGLAPFDRAAFMPKSPASAVRSDPPTSPARCARQDPWPDRFRRRRRTSTPRPPRAGTVRRSSRSRNAEPALLSASRRRSRSRPSCRRR